MPRRVNNFFPEFSAIFPKRKNGIESFPIPFPKIGVLFRDQREGIVVGPVKEGKDGLVGAAVINFHPDLQKLFIHHLVILF